MSPLHVLALLKGVVEGEPDKHFASLQGWQSHLAVAIRLRLVVAPTASSVEEVRVTERGSDLYERAALWALPPGRANAWGDAAMDAVRLLEQLGHEAKETTMMGASSTPGRPLATITIHGQWTRPVEKVAEVIEGALCAAGFCGCGGPGNGFTLSMSEESAEDDDA